MTNTAKWVSYGIATAIGVVAFLVSRKTSLELPDCDDSLKATKHGSTRDMKNVRLIVLHSTEGETASGAAGWFANDASQGSAHIVVDNNKCFRTLADNVIPWGSKGGRSNEDGLHLEMAGYAKYDSKTWLTSRLETIEKGAAIVQNWARMYGIPTKFLSVEDLIRDGNNARGITTHANLSKAFKISGGHTDPGVGFPIEVFMDLVKGRSSNKMILNS